MINNDCGRLQDRILLFDTPMGTRNYFFEIYRQLWASAIKKVRHPWARSFSKGKERDRRLHSVLEVDYSRTAKSDIRSK
jgi:hypothetical protein